MNMEMNAKQIEWLKSNGFEISKSNVDYKFTKTGEATDGYGGTVPATWHVYRETAEGGWNAMLESKFGCYDRCRQTTLKYALQCVTNKF